MRILVVEDERKLANFLRRSLGEEGFDVASVSDGKEGLKAALTTEYDALVLDILLPHLDGLSILREMRSRGRTVPVLLLSARGEVSERIEGLDLGADDYLPKPFAMSELIARLRALLRRNAASQFLEVADLKLDLLSREASRGSRTIALTPREFACLEYLMRTPGRMLTRTEISRHVWGNRFAMESNLLDVYVQRLRRKIEVGTETKLLLTVRGAGYVVKGPDAAIDAAPLEGTAA